MADGKALHEGDQVSWRTHGTTTHGTVEREITSDTQAAGRTVRADEGDPQYLVTSSKTGRQAVHKPAALDKDPSTQGSPDSDSLDTNAQDRS